MLRDDSDSSWAKWGEQNPYFGVLADDRFRHEKISEEAKAELFETGRIHVDRIVSIITSQFGGFVARKSALDFGCGVGRLVIPLARVFERVTAADVSKGMLETAERNCSVRGINNVDFVHSDDGLTKITHKFDFIHSYLVLQHIPTQRGERIISQLIELLNVEGILAIHFPFARKDSLIRQSVYFLRKHFAPISMLANVLRGKRWNEPFMQMNCYDVDRILSSISEHGIRDVFMEIVDAGGFMSAFVFARKPTRAMGKVEGKHLWAADLRSR